MDKCTKYSMERSGMEFPFPYHDILALLLGTIVNAQVGVLINTIEISVSTQWRRDNDILIKLFWSHLRCDGTMEYRLNGKRYLPLNIIIRIIPSHYDGFQARHISHNMLSALSRYFQTKHCRGNRSISVLLLYPIAPTRIGMHPCIISRGRGSSHCRYWSRSRTNNVNLYSSKSKCNDFQVIEKVSILHL